MELDDFASHASKAKAAHPKGWEPGFEWDGTRGTVTTEPQTKPLEPGEEPDFAHILRFFGYDPDLFDVEGAVQHRAWQQKAGEPFLLYYRASIVRRGIGSDNDVDVDALVASVSRRKPRKTETSKAPVDGTSGLVVAMGDWQVGKGDGDGVEGTVARLAAIPDLIEQRWRELRKIGVPLETLYLCFGGDLREACSGHYAQQLFRTTLNNRDQRKVIRAAADTIIDRSAGLAPQVAVKVVGGNHGEERDGGKANSDTADNVDVAVIEDIAYAYSHAPAGRYDHVSFALPNADLTATFDHGGFIVGLAHGHQAQKSSGSGPQQKIHAWWKGQMDGQRPIGDADLLVTFHFHHPWLIQRGTRTQIGTSALDGGSEYFIDATGQDAPASTTSFVVDGRGWSHYQLLR